ncbi:MAG: nucleotide disphospho-sugar-binding domain-containing protein [Bacteroidota bacterium]
MAHIVCITTGLTGILYASLELVKRLESAGHRVTYACPAEVGEKVRANGVTYHQLPATNYFPEPELPNFKGKTRKLKRWWHKLIHAKQRKRAAVENLGMKAFEQTLENWSPDLLLIDVELHEHLMTATARHYKVLLLSQWFFLGKRPSLPPLVSDIIPQKGFNGSSLGIAFAWKRIQFQRWWMFNKKRIRSVGTNRRTVLKKYANQIGFSLKKARANYWPGPFTYNDLPILSMTLQEAEFPYAKPIYMNYVGAMILEKRADIDVSEEVNVRLDRIFEEKKQQSASLIYCSVSTFKAGDKSFLVKLVQAIANRPDYILILGLGGLLESDFLPSLPTNVHAFSWIPQLKVLKEADCSINHGGIHTINECIHFKVPMLVYSGKRSDQNGCAARIAYHGFGMMADKDKDSSAQIIQKIDRVLKNATYEEKMEQIHQKYQKYRANAVLEHHIANALKKP